MNKESGQITVEAVLIITLFASVMIFTSRQIQSRRMLSSLVEAPWSYIQGMIENGIWGPVEAGKRNHPNQVTRHGSPQGDAP